MSFMKMRLAQVFFQLNRENPWVASALRMSVAKVRRRFESLPPREREVTSMVVSGMPNKQISSQLGTSENTVKVHRSRAMEKMQARSLPELVRMMDQLKDLFETAS
jgi:RNA polymerase sigma factor (sigma-70 family)